jgi:hypothetical protein
MGSVASDDLPDEADAAGPDAPSLDPITERILHALPGSHWILMVLWAGLSLLSPLVFSMLVRTSGRPFPVAHLDSFAHRVGGAHAAASRERAPGRLRR